MRPTTTMHHTRARMARLAMESLFQKLWLLRSGATTRNLQTLVLSQLQARALRMWRLCCRKRKVKQMKPLMVPRSKIRRRCNKIRSTKPRRTLDKATYRRRQRPSHTWCCHPFTTGSKSAEKTSRIAAKSRWAAKKWPPQLTKLTNKTTSTHQPRANR